MTLGFLVLRDFRWVCIVKPVPGIDSTLIIKIVLVLLRQFTMI